MDDTLTPLAYKEIMFMLDHFDPDDNGTLKFQINNIKIIATGNRNIRVKLKKRTKKGIRYVSAIKKDDIATEFVYNISEDFKIQSYRLRPETRMKMPWDEKFYAFLFYYYSTCRAGALSVTDTDNIDKGLMDALERAGVISNDKYAYIRTSLKDISEVKHPFGDQIKVILIKKDSRNGRIYGKFMEMFRTRIFGGRECNERILK